jgi:hypothetical protein
MKFGVSIHSLIEEKRVVMNTSKLAGLTHCATLVLPRSGVSVALRTSLQQRTRDSLQLLLNEVQRATHADMELQRSLLSTLDIDQRFSPYLYSVYFSLLEHMSEGDAEKVMQTCNRLTEVAENPYCDELVIQSTIDNDIFHSYRMKRLMQSPLDAKKHEIAKEKLDSLYKNKIANVYQTIHQADKHLADEINTLLSMIHLTTEAFPISSLSSMALFGMILIDVDDKKTEAEQHLHLYDSVVHEAAHLYLNLLMSNDPFITNGDDQDYSPARTEIRPIKGILHAHFVFFRSLLAYHAAQDRLSDAKETGLSQNEAEAAPLPALPLSFAVRQHAYRHKFFQGNEILRRSAHFTECGSEFMQVMEQIINDL